MKVAGFKLGVMVGMIVSSVLWVLILWLNGYLWVLAA